MSLGVETKITVSDMNIWTSQFHMASASSAPLLKSTVSFSFTIVLIILASLQTASGCFTSIFAFGDSLTDPGNYVNIYPQIFPQNQSPPRIGLPPYGETYFHHPTGRCSNGRLIVDFIAEYYGLPLIPPYIRGVNQNGSDFEVGVNFAVQGVPALDVAFYEEQGIHYTLSNISMSTQLRWFRELLPSLCNSSSCSEAFKHSLFLMGSFGGNDYGNAFQQGKSLEEIKSFTPLIISAISSAIEDIDVNTSTGSPRRRLDFDVVDHGDNDDVSSPMVLNMVKDVNKIHASIAPEIIPKIGMEFDSEPEAYDFYLAYAKEVGFGIKRTTGHKDKNGKHLDRVFCCSAEGKRVQDKRDINVRAHRPETRFGCLAKMKVNSRQTGKYRISQLIIEHNHYLSSPNKTHLHRSHRKIISAHGAEIDMAHSVGLAPKISHELMALQAGGQENLGFIPEDLKNYLRSKRTTRMKVGDTGGVLEYLQRMQLEDPNFFYAIQVDEDDLITNIFWTDGKMKTDYSSFGDVVCFDTTYRKNSEGRPLALFVGVNHHKQTTIFGAALLYDETALTFEWLFDTFARAMLGKKPDTILTDQDAAMARALTSMWPETHHRLCIWHIFQNAAIHLNHVFENFKEFASDFSSCVYGFDEEEEFICEWDAMLKKYDLEENDWLKRMYEIKEKWALVYGRETFCADMTTTQRSESMNSVIKRYAASVYTPEVFKWFQTEWGKSHDCALVTCGEVGTVTEYKITPKGKTYHHTVRLDSTEIL